MPSNKFEFEQYKLVLDSLQTDNNTREASNQFWISVNSIGLAAITYIKDKKELHAPEGFLIWGLITIGVILGILWCNSLFALKKRMISKCNLIIDYEKNMKSKAFSKILNDPDKNLLHYSSVTTQEIFTALLFTFGYIMLGILFYYYF